MDRRVVVVLGATGRLGPAVTRALNGHEVRGLSRRAPIPDEGVECARFVVAERRDRSALLDLCEGADAVVDLIGFSEEDAQVLVAALSEAKRGPRHLVFASSVAEREARDPYGRGKMRARRLYEERFKGPVHSLVLPRLVARVDPGRRDQPYLDSAAAGRALVAGGGEQRQTIAPVEGVAQLVRALVDDPGRVPPGPLAVGPPTPVRVRDAVAALLDGAGLRAPLARHPDPDWRGPHGGGDEILDTTLLPRLIPEIVWPDPVEEHRALGAWLAARPVPRRRPRQLVQVRHQEYRGHGVVDVHGRREPSGVKPVPELTTLVSWLAPSFYVDLGRPCNSACVYCAVSPHADTEGFAPRERIQEQVRVGMQSRCDRAILIGGEPTISPRFFEALGMLADAGVRGRQVVMTNGLTSADPAFVARMVEAGVATLHLSLDTSDEATYERLSRTPGTFGRQRAALDNVLGRGDLNLYIYTVVTRVNAPGLSQHLRALAGAAERAGRSPPPVVLAFVKPVGDALAHAGELLLAPPERARLAREAAVEAARLGVPLGLRSIQPCLVPELEPLLLDAYLEDYSLDLATGARRPDAHHQEYQRYLQVCAPCSRRGWCGGVYREDVLRFGDDFFRTLQPAPAG